MRRPESGGKAVRASAFIVGSGEEPVTALEALARSLGFAPIIRYTNMSAARRQVDETPLVFFLCAPVKDVSELKPLTNAVRFSDDMRLRFSPLIYFTPEPSVERIRACINMGFDDVIATPYAGGDLAERIGRQVGQTHIYYETATYFGPDRRNRVGPPRSSDSDHGGGQFRRIEIVRTDAGVDVLRDDFQVMI
jgi:hypothetical protein